MFRGGLPPFGLPMKGGTSVSFGGVQCLALGSALWLVGATKTGSRHAGEREPGDTTLESGNGVRKRGPGTGSGKQLPGVRERGPGTGNHECTLAF